MICTVPLACALLGCDRRPAAESPPAQPGPPVYSIEGTTMGLEDGTYAGEDGTVSLLESSVGDLNKDGLDDRAALLILNSAGTGVFYYLNVFLGDASGQWRLAGEEFLGDRIGFDFMDIYGEGSVSSLTGIAIHPDDYGQLVVAFHIHSIEQSFAEQPRLYITRRWKVDGEKVVLIEDY